MNRQDIIKNHMIKNTPHNLEIIKWSKNFNTNSDFIYKCRICKHLFSRGGYFITTRVCPKCK